MVLVTGRSLTHSAISEAARRTQLRFGAVFNARPFGIDMPLHYALEVRAREREYHFSEVCLDDVHRLLLSYQTSHYMDKRNFKRLTNYLPRITSSTKSRLAALSKKAWRASRLSHCQYQLLLGTLVRSLHETTVEAAVPTDGVW
jgi:hypothetical protein